MGAEEELLKYALICAAEEAAKLALCPKRAMQNLGRLSTHSEKLVYLFLCITQPQTFTGMRRALGMDKATLSRALKGLLEKRLITVKDFLYWVNLHSSV